MSNSLDFLSNLPVKHFKSNEPTEPGNMCYNLVLHVQYKCGHSLPGTSGKSKVRKIRNEGNSASLRR